jgi:hypothetical protein
MKRILLVALLGLTVVVTVPIARAHTGVEAAQATGRSPADGRQSCGGSAAIRKSYQVPNPPVTSNRGPSSATRSSTGSRGGIRVCMASFTREIIEHGALPYRWSGSDRLY